MLEMATRKNTTLIIAAVIVVAIGGVWWWMSRPGESVQIQQKGSDTLLVLAQNWAEQYMATVKNVEIVVSGGGSGTGISALINKQIDIADASRQIKSSEIEAANDGGVNPVEWKVALDGISVIVHTANPLEEITYGQLRGIYNGSIVDWSEVDGDPGVIVAYGRQSTSGTYVYFNEEVLDEDDYRADKQQLAGNAEIVEAVINDPNGIGYVGVAYAQARGDELKILKVKKEASDTSYLPTSTNIANGNYPISRYLYVYTDSIPEGETAKYLQYILGSDGQEIANQVGYISIPDSVANEQLNKLE